MPSSARILHGDCVDLMGDMPDASVDAIVTDPPYGLGFMGRAWDSLPPALPWAEQCLRVLKPGGHLVAFGGTRTWHRLAVAVEDAGFEIRDSIAWLYGSGMPKAKGVLKPAFEPIVLARKRFPGSARANVAAYGTGELSTSISRIPFASEEDRAESVGKNQHGKYGSKTGQNVVYGDFSMVPSHDYNPGEGRHPTNLLLDEEVADDLGINGRFFYTAKAGRHERPVVNGVTHPTVKPLSLMRHLVKLATPPGGVVLDTFAGSGTTVEAALLEGLDAIGIESAAEYMPLIEARIARTPTTTRKDA